MMRVITKLRLQLILSLTELRAMSWKRGGGEGEVEKEMWKNEVDAPPH